MEFVGGGVAKIILCNIYQFAGAENRKFSFFVGKSLFHRLVAGAGQKAKNLPVFYR
ncbi:hypothetical protein [Neisseria gonorrhoeae]|uniref:hypothetical protein n=1 Tax=Neisseria gonorrhoeae TaxID=485 RepID=UPI00155E67A3|nr:hypothetical protein [Neisseria gonorrhoeae]